MVNRCGLNIMVIALLFEVLDPDCHSGCNSFVSLRLELLSELIQIKKCAFAESRLHTFIAPSVWPAPILVTNITRSSNI